MAERPILFSGQLVRAILEGRKTETRRLVKVKPSPRARLLFDRMVGAETDDAGLQPRDFAVLRRDRRLAFAKECGPCEAGNTLWVRESWRAHSLDLASASGVRVSYTADGATRYIKSRAGHEWVAEKPDRRVGGHPSIHMPRWASRITLAVTDVRVERLTEITGRGVLAEGVDNGSSNPAMGARWENMQRMAFEQLWDQINGKRAGATWADDPWVWVVKFGVKEVLR